MPAVFEIEQALLLLEIEPPFDQRDVQLARRRLAKVWHPDLAPPGRQFEHERHLKAINDAADQLISLAEGSRGGRVSRNAVKVSAAASRKARAEEGRRAYEAEQRARAAAADQAKHDPFGSRMPDHSVVHRYARCLSYPEWGVGSVTGIYFTGSGDDVQQWARVKFSPGVRTVPAGSLQFVDFSKPDPGAERVQRFMTAAQHAMAEGDYPLAAKRLIFARDAEPTNAAVLRLMTLAFWQAGELTAAGRAVRDWARVEGDRPAPHRFAARIYEDMGAIDLAAEAADRAAARGPQDADAWERVGRLRLRLMDRAAAITALEMARRLGPSVEGLLDLALAHHLAGDLGAEVTATEQATLLEPSSAPAWARYAHALARTDRISDAIAAAERAVELNRDDGEVADLLERLRAALPRVLPRGVIAWAFDRAALGPLPEGVELAAELGPGVEFAVVHWEDLRALEGLSDLRVIQTVSAGVDWIVDRVPEGVTLCSAKGARDRAMAEWVMAAILADAKRARECAEQQSRRQWEFVTLGDASGLRVLVLGFGSIGRTLAAMLVPFDCEVVGVARRARDGVHGADELGDLLPDADVVVNLLPLTEATRGSIGASELAAMREGALYVNAGRGATTDTAALVAALRAGRIRAVLDVVDPEPLPSEHPLWTAPGVMISPHSAGDTPGADLAAWSLAAAQLRRYAAGDPLENVVSDGY